MFKDWIGREETRTETADQWPIRGLCALLDRSNFPGPGAAIPHAGHWTYFVPAAPQSELDHDGHPKRGGFLPPFAQPRRMWAGSDIVFGTPIRIGDLVTKTARIADISVKDGRSGQLVFLKLDNLYDVGGEMAVRERQTLVYRDAPTGEEPAAAPRPAPVDPDWSRGIEASAALLFRYSAVTFNAHRIHYDAPYAEGEEGYPGIVAQGQLVATLLLEEVRQRYPERPIASFDFRLVKPLFGGASVFVEGKLQDERTVALWSRDMDGALSLTATLAFGQK